MNAIDWAFSLLAKFLADKSYGEITFNVQEGKIINVKTVKSEKPPLDTMGQKS
jgi:hypothetical protein